MSKSQYLSVRQSKSLVNLQVVAGEARNLRYLEVSHCLHLEHVEISAPNLVSFSYFGHPIDEPLKITPKLFKLSVGSSHGLRLISNSSEYSSSLRQLEEFKLDLKCQMIKYALRSADQFPICTRLKRLELVVSPEVNEDLVLLDKMLKACPFLHEFSLTVHWCSYIESEWFEEEDCRFYNLNMWEVESRPQYHVIRGVGQEICPHEQVKRLELEACPHYHLKMVEIVGFVGNTIELEFVIYLLETCIAMEKFVIDPRRLPLDVGTGSQSREKKREAHARKKAEQLRAKVQPRADLMIL